MHEQERWMESLRQREADLLALLETVPESNSSVIAFKAALERHREAVGAFTTSLSNDCKVSRPHA